MNLSELIVELNELKEEYGDMVVHFKSPGKPLGEKIIYPMEMDEWGYVLYMYEEKADDRR
jgi:hypothetical protein